MTELTIFFLLLVKHAIADIGLQTQLLWGRANEKSRYFGGHQHYLHHAMGTFLVFVWFLNFTPAILLSMVDYIAHWHTDFIKTNVNRYFKLSRQNVSWWWITAIDQLIHFLTYYLLMLYVISY